MNIINNVADLKDAAAKDNRASFAVVLNSEIIDFLYSIRGKNREWVRSNLASWQECIRHGEWSFDNCEIKINSSCTWLIEGHHRVLAVKLERAFGLLARVIVVPDENQDVVFRNQDSRGCKRNLATQATLCGIKNAAAWLAIEKAYRKEINGDGIPSTIDGCERFLNEKQGVIDRLDIRRELVDEKKSAPCCCIAAIIRAAEKFPERIDDINAFWGRVISGEMITSTMPEWCLRSRIKNGVDSHKEITMLTFKALQMAIDGIECKLLKLSDSDVTRLGKVFGIATKRNICHIAATGVEAVKLNADSRAAKKAKEAK